MENKLTDIFEKLDRRQVVTIIRDALNRTEKLKLEYPDSKSEDSGNTPDLVQFASKGNKVDIACKIKSDLFIDGDVVEIAKYGKIYPEIRIIFVVLDSITAAKRKTFLDHRALKEISFVTLFDINDIDSRINQFEDLQTKIYNLSYDVAASPFEDSEDSKSQRPDESTRDYRQRLRTDKSANKKISDKSIELKHALSTNKEDQKLLEKGYKNQAHIGYLYTTEQPNTKPLYQEYINEWNDYFYYVDPKLEDIANFKTSEKKTIGYLATESERSDLGLERYFNEKTYDHFYCVLPNKKLLLDYDYEGEPDKGFFGTFLLPQAGKDIIPLYVYSTNPDLYLFTAPNIKVDNAEEKGISDSDLSKENILKLINFNLSARKKFWWLNTQTNIGQDIPTNAGGARFRESISSENFPKGISEEEVVIANYQGNNDIWGLTQFSEYNSEETNAWFKLLYDFSEVINVSDLMQISGFEEAYNSFVPNKLYELNADLFKEIINTTELADLSTINADNDWNESPPEIDELYDDDPASEESKDSIPFHLDQVENTDRLNREPIAKSISGLLNKQIFSSPLRKSFFKRGFFNFLGFLQIHKISRNLFGFPQWIQSNIKSIRNEKRSRHAFMIHLQGAWGDGKSTFLNLIESNLNTDDRKWLVIKFNAWQHQQILPPWWSFLDQIYTQSVSRLPWFKALFLWLKETRRRLFNMNTIYNLLTFSIVILIGFLIIHFFPSITKFYTSSSEKELSIDEKLINLSKVMAAVGTLGGLIYAGARFIAKPLLLKSPQSAKSFIQQVADPMVTIKKHFESLVGDIEVSGYRVAIFIDDLDRCNSKFAVELLEGIQTLYKDRKVLYLVAGDKNWISECFENHYTDFSNVVKEPGQKLGYLFLEKAFQLSIRLPQITGKVKDRYWQFILDPNNSANVEKGKEVETKAKPDRTPEETQEMKEKFKQRFNKQEYSSPEQIESIAEELGASDTEATDMGLEIMNEDALDVKHRLQNHSELIEANPRSIKRLANQYNVYRDILFAERRKFDPDKLFRWLIIQNVYPLYADLVEKDSKVYVKSNLPKELSGLKDNLHWQKLIMDAKKERGGKLLIEDIEQFVGAEKEKPKA